MDKTKYVVTLTTQNLEHDLIEDLETRDDVSSQKMIRNVDGDLVTPVEGMVFESYEAVCRNMLLQMSFVVRSRRLKLIAWLGTNGNANTSKSFAAKHDGDESAPFGERDGVNYSKPYRALRLGEGDVEALFIHFMWMQERDPNFFHAIDVRVNHHGRSVLLGCRFQMRILKLLFGCLRLGQSACQEFPCGIITDQCKSMQNAIAEVFPHTHRRWFAWHIMRKLSKRLGSYSCYQEIKELLRDLIYNSLRVSDFEQAIPLITDLWFEKQIGDIYTVEMFKKYQNAVKSLIFCSSVAPTVKSGQISTFHVKDCSKRNNVTGKMREPTIHEVVIDIENMDVKYICQLFEFKGIVCRHALCVLMDQDISSLPPQCFLSHWRKDMKRPHTSVKNMELDENAGFALEPNMNSEVLDLVQVPKTSSILLKEKRLQ
ncbi:hypothetical protein ACH5RR_039214 [Cinchona calisaya]|uniref:Protein FAR1-RELATED SEQUENCE n=1 Tax=Cinchona calisaya TaxID=153742 RepID=A0ABD2XXJ9_9GENT